MDVGILGATKFAFARGGNKSPSGWIVRLIA